MVLRTGMERFPESRLLRIYFADMLSGMGRTREALGMLEEANRFPYPTGLDAASDRQQRAMVFQRIGSIQLSLNHLDAALTACRRGCGDLARVV